MSALEVTVNIASVPAWETVGWFVLPLTMDTSWLSAQPPFAATILMRLEVASPVPCTLTVPAAPVASAPICVDGELAVVTEEPTTARGASGRDNAGSAARVNARAHPGDARGETAHGERGGHRLELDRSISDTCASIAIRGTLCGPWRTSPVSWSALAGRSARRQVGLHFCGFSRQEGVSAVPCETERSQSRDF